MVKILTFYIITTRTVAMSLKGLFTLLLKQHDLFFELYMILMRLRNQKAAINNKFSTKEQLCVLNTVN